MINWVCREAVLPLPRDGVWVLVEQQPDRKMCWVIHTEKMEVLSWPGDWNLPSIDINCLEVLVRKLISFTNFDSAKYLLLLFLSRRLTLSFRNVR